MISRSFKPFNADLLNVILKTHADEPFRVKSRENSRIEFKEAFNFGSREDYAKTMASFANASGGYLIFGVTNSPRIVVGLKTQNFEEFDPAKLTEFLSSTFSPEIEWELHTHDFSGKKVGLLYTWELREKPLVCCKTSGNTLREADIYYRYRGRSERIRFPELIAILKANRDRERDLWRGYLEKMAKVGVSNVGIMDTATGEVSGPGGSFVISETLLPKLTFIKEGTFKEKQGAPTLKVIGNVKPVGTELITPVEIIIQHEPLDASEVIIRFLEERTTPEPLSYIKVICTSPTAFLPVYWYVHQSGKAVDEIIEFIEQLPSRSPSRGKLVGRLRGADTAKIGSIEVDSYSADKRRQYVGNLRMGDVAVDDTQSDELRYFFQAITHLEPGECDLMPILKATLTLFKTRYAQMDGGNASLMRRAICHLDRILYAP
jgi:Predicted transcriptional regulator containing an HTH domain and an uncharacterized domain shared with the mammalian protein Schlafen